MINDQEHDDQWYIRRELFKAQPVDDEDIVRMKLWAKSGGESRWVIVPSHVLDLLTTVASLTPHEAAVLTSMIQGLQPNTELGIKARKRIHCMVLGIDES